MSSWCHFISYQNKQYLPQYSEIDSDIHNFRKTIKVAHAGFVSHRHQSKTSSFLQSNSLRLNVTVWREFDPAIRDHEEPSPTRKDYRNWGTILNPGMIVLLRGTFGLLSEKTPKKPQRSGYHNFKFYTKPTYQG